MSRDLTDLTGGFVGRRDPAAPLVTMYDGDARVELSGTTVANWVSKSANLLVDGLGAPGRVGLLLPLHWQAVCLLLAGVASDAEIVVAAHPDQLAGCEAAFVLAGQAAAAMAAGVNEVLGLSGHPLGAPATSLPPLVLDYALEVPGYGDHYGGPRPGPARLAVGGSPVEALPGIGPADRVLTCLDLSDRAGAAAVLGALAAGAGLVLLRGADAGAVAAAERVTLTAGVSVAGVTPLD